MTKISRDEHRAKMVKRRARQRRTPPKIVLDVLPNDPLAAHLHTREISRRLRQLGAG